MSFKFLPEDETVEQGVRRIALDQIERALAGLDDPDLDLGEKIHVSRRRCKKLRAMLRLVRPVLKQYGTFDAVIRDAAASLSTARDAQVQLETYDALTRPGGGRKKVRSALLEQAQAAKDAEKIQDILEDFGSIMRSMRWPVSEMRLTRDGFRAIADGLEVNYADGRDALRAAGRKQEDEQFHDARKSLKYYMHHCNLLRETAPQLLDAQRELASDAGDALGDHHNLAVLKQTCSTLPSGDDIVELAMVRQEELARTALRLGGQLMAEEPKAMRQRLHHYWRDWQSGS
jgi:hypothetical protein